MEIQSKQSQNEENSKSLAMVQDNDAAVDENRMMRIILESLEVALLLCNLCFESYGLAKLFSIINQILPTAYIVNTGYWVFYSSINGLSLCICNRFGIRCTHHRKGFHWIDIEAMKDAEENYLFSMQNGKMFPVSFNVGIQPVTSDILRAYDLNIRLTVQPFCVQGNNHFPLTDQKTTLLIDARYILTPSYNQLENSIVQFNPHPMSHPHYAKYFDCLHGLNVLYSSPFKIEMPQTHTIICSDIPNFTVITNNSARSNFRPTPEVNSPTWSGPFTTFYGHFQPTRPTPTSLQQQYFHFNYSHNAMILPPYPVPLHNTVTPYQQIAPPPYAHTSSYRPTPSYLNRTNKRQCAEQPTRYMPLPMLPDSSTDIKQKKPGKAAVPTKPKNEAFGLSPSMPSLFYANRTYQETSPRQLISSNTQLSASLGLTVQNPPKFNPTIRKPLNIEAPKHPDRNFYGPDYHDRFPALPSLNGTKKKSKIRSIRATTTTEIAGTTFDFDNLNIAPEFDPILPANIPNLKSEIEVQRITSIRYNTEDSQMVSQSLNDDIDTNELLSLLTDVIEEDINKDLSIIKPEEFDNFQEAQAVAKLPENTFDEPATPDDDCLYIAEFGFLDDDDEK